MRGGGGVLEGFKYPSLAPGFVLFFLSPAYLEYRILPHLYLYYKNCSDCSVSQSVSQSVRPSADICALKEISRNLGNHRCSQFLFSIFFAEI